MAKKKQEAEKRAGCRRFVLERIEDETGMSGTGIVAEGVEFSNGWCALTWLSMYSSMVFYPNIKDVDWIHGHAGSGKTKVVWVD